MPSQSQLGLSYLKYGISAGAALLALRLCLQLSTVSKVPIPEPIRSPRWDIPTNLSQEELDGLPYPLDVFPGGRDVETPFGSIRVFEWGPETGRKVLFVHGISTPAMALGGLAEELVEKGCRVMLFDLFGRGYSDTPIDMPQDARLFMTQILLVISSSPLPWTGNSGFNLVGYSLGAGVSMSFTRYLPHLVQSITLIAPSGLIRPNHISWKSKILYSHGLLPSFLLEYLVKKRLQPQIQPLNSPCPNTMKDVVETVSVGTPTDPDEESPSGSSETTGSTASDTAVLSKRFPHITIASAVSWQLSHHAGFIRAFISSIRHGPIYNQHSVWAITGARLSAQKATVTATAKPVDAARRRGMLHGGKVLMVLGAADPVVHVEEISEDARAVLGEGNVEIVVVVDAGHEVPITRRVEVAEAMWRFWMEEE